jgi:hypothetical protein
MGKVRANAARRRRIGRVSIYPHRRRWWVYYREHGQPARKAVADDAAAAEEVAAQINLELTASAPTLFSFRPVSVAGLQKAFFDYRSAGVVFVTQTWRPVFEVGIEIFELINHVTEGITLTRLGQKVRRAK